MSYRAGELAGGQSALAALQADLSSEGSRLPAPPAPEELTPSSELLEHPHYTWHTCTKIHTQSKTIKVLLFKPRLVFTTSSRPVGVTQRDTVLKKIKNESYLYIPASVNFN